MSRPNAALAARPTPRPAVKQTHPQRGAQSLPAQRAQPAAVAPRGAQPATGHSPVSRFEPPPPAREVAPTLRSGIRGPEVQRLQEQLNQYRGRAVPPLAPVPTSGAFDGATRAAVCDYQRLNRLPVTGTASPALQTHLQLRNDSNFRHLGLTTQNEVLGRVMSARTPQAREQLVRLATEPAFSQLNATHQREMLAAQGASSSSVAMATDGLIRLARSSAFRELNDATRSQVLQTYALHTGSQADVDRCHALVTNPRFVHLTPADQERTLRVFTAADAQGRAALTRLVSERPQVLTQSALRAGAQATLLDSLERLAQGGNPHPDALNSTLQELADPDRQINQGPRSSLCTTAALSHTLATDHPAEYARLVADLALTGRAQLADGTTVSAPDDGVVRDTSTGRSPSETLLQNALYERGRELPNYNARADDPAMFSRRGEEGLFTHQQAQVMRSVLGRPVRITQPVLAGGMVDTSGVMRSAERALASGQRVHANVLVTAQGQRTGHAVEILRTDREYVYYRDPMGRDAAQANAGIHPPSEVSGDASTGIRRMRRGDFEDTVNNILVFDR